MTECPSTPTTFGTREPMPAPSRRRWFRFSLRTLLILTAMLAILLAQRPYTRWGPSVSNKVAPPGMRYADGVWSDPPLLISTESSNFRWALSDRFKFVASMEVIVLALWAGAVFYRRRRLSERAN